MKLNTVVRSIAGRDRGEWFAVVGESQGFVLIANGKSRPLIHPKRKKAKHLEITCYQLCDKSLETDRKLRTALKEFSADSYKGGK